MRGSHVQQIVKCSLFWLSKGERWIFASTDVLPRWRLRGNIGYSHFYQILVLKNLFGEWLLSICLESDKDGSWVLLNTCVQFKSKNGSSRLIKSDDGSTLMWDWLECLRRGLTILNVTEESSRWGIMEKRLLRPEETAVGLKNQIFFIISFDYEKMTIEYCFRHPYQL